MFRASLVIITIKLEIHSCGGSCDSEASSPSVCSSPSYSIQHKHNSAYCWRKKVWVCSKTVVETGTGTNEGSVARGRDPCFD